MEFKCPKCNGELTDLWNKNSPYMFEWSSDRFSCVGWVENDPIYGKWINSCVFFGLEDLEFER